MIAFAITSHAAARTLCISASHNSSLACLLNHRLQTNRQYTTHAAYSFPPASLAVLITFFVIIGLLALVTFHSSNSMGTTSSIWYLRRRATLVTSFAGRPEGGKSVRLVGSTAARSSAWLVTWGGER